MHSATPEDQWLINQPPSAFVRYPVVFTSGDGWQSHNFSFRQFVLHSCWLEHKRNLSTGQTISSSGKAVMSEWCHHASRWWVRLRVLHEGAGPNTWSVFIIHDTFVADVAAHLWSLKYDTRWSAVMEQRLLGNSDNRGAISSRLINSRTQIHEVEMTS